MDVYEKNLSLLSSAEENGQYPNLFKLLNRYGGSCWHRLRQLYEYFAEQQRNGYGEYCEFHKVQEAFASFDELIKRYRGNKETWKSATFKLAAMGLLIIHVPDQDRRYNSARHIESIERAKAAGHRYPVTWYGIPEYTESLLEQANSRANNLQWIKGKDGLRDILGVSEANRITGTGWNIHPDTDERRRVLKAALHDIISKNGYAYAEDVIAMAEKERLSEGDGWRVRKTWEEYKTILYFEMDMVYSRPNKEDKKKYKLETDKYIIKSYEGGVQDEH